MSLKISSGERGMRPILFLTLLAAPIAAAKTASAQIVDLGGGEFAVRLVPAFPHAVQAGRDRPGTPLLHLDLEMKPAFSSGGFLIDSITANPGGPTFTFDSNAQGWFNEPEEPFAVDFEPSGIDGGSLRLSTSTPRTAFEIENAYDSAWSAVQGSYSSIDFRLRFDNPAITPFIADFRIDDGSQAAYYAAPIPEPSTLASLLWISVVVIKTEILRRR